MKFRIRPKKILKDFEPMILQILIFCGPVLGDMCVLDFRNITSPKMPQKSDRKVGALKMCEWQTNYCYLIRHKGHFCHIWGRGNFNAQINGAWV
jgi:hypothetical protein